MAVGVESMAQKVLVAGVGMAPFVPLGGSASALAVEAVRAALADAALDFDLIDQGYIASVRGGAAEIEQVLVPFGMSGLPLFNARDGCVSGQAAIHLARQSLLAGEAECVLVLGYDAMPVGVSSRGFFDLGEFQQEPGAGCEAVGAAPQLSRRQHPAELYAAQTGQLLTRLGVAESGLELVLARARARARLNPYALFYRPRDVDSWLAPYLCAPASGAAAVILCTAGFAQRFGLRAEVACLASLRGGDIEGDLDSGSVLDVLGRSATRRLAAHAYELAGLGPEDIDVVELHDQSVGDYLINSAALGFCREDELQTFAEGLHPKADVTVAICPSGGLLGRGHAPGASGVAQMVELVWQLRGLAGARQRPGARTGLQQGSALGRAVSLCVLQRVK